MTDLFKKTAIFSLSVITAIGMMGAIAAPSTANAQSLSSSQIDSIISLLQSFGADQNTIDNVEASLMGEATSGSGSGTTGGTTGSTPACSFDRSLSQGDTGSDVKCLQQYLNNTGYTVSASGAGSPGNETEYFGSRTKQAVVAWQNANATDVLQPVGLSTGTGYWGPSSISHYNQVASTGSGTGDTGDTGADTPSSGVEVSSKSLSSITVPQNATLIEVGEFSFASGENTDIDTLNFQRKGAGNRNDWDKLYIYQDGKRITSSGRTVNTDQALDFSNLDIDLDDGEVTTLTLKGTVSTSNSGNVHYFDLTNVELSDSGVDVSGLPQSSREVTIGGVTSGSLDFDYNSPVDTTVNLGETDIEVFNADLTSSNEDMNLKSVILEQYGSVDVDELDNWKVMFDGSEADDASVSVDGDEVTITFDGDGKFIEDGDTKELALHADMTSGAYIKGGTGTIELNVDESSNVDAQGLDFGYGANITHTDGFGNPPTGDSMEITINASELTFTYVGPQTGDIGLNAEDVVLFETDLVTQAEFEFDNLSIRFDPSNTNNPIHLQNLKLRNKTTGRVLAGPDEIASTTSQTDHNFDDVFTIPEGTNTLQVIADIGNDTQNGAELTTSLLVDVTSASDDLSAENLNTSENVDVTNDVIPADVLAGKKQTLTQADLSISDDATAQTFVVGKSGAVLGSYVLESSGVSDIDVRQLQFDFSVSSSTAAALSGSLTLRKGSATGAALDSEAVDTGSAEDSMTFDTSGSLKIPSGGDETVYLVGDLKSDYSGPDADTNTTASTTVTSVTAKDANNENPLFNGNSTFNNVAGETHTIAATGSFNTVAFNGNNPSEDQIIVPGNSVLFSSYRLRPQNEDIQMRDWVVNIASSSEASFFNRVRTVVDGTEVANKPITGATVTFENVNVDVTKDQDSEWQFKADLVDDFTNLTSGTELQLYFSTTTTNYDIIGLDSGSSVTFTTSSIDSASDGIRTYQIANSYPTFNFVGSDATLSAGTKNLYKFEVTAENDDVELRELTFDIQVSEGSSSTNGDLQVGSFELLKNGNVVGTASTTDSDSSGTIGDNGADGASETASTTIKISNVSDYTVGAGNTATFTLRGNVTGVGSDDANSISTNIDNSDEDASFAANDTYNTASSTGNTIWSDTYRHFNGTYIDFPTDQQTLSL